MGYMLGIGLLLFGILLAQVPPVDGAALFLLAGLLFGAAGLIKIIATHLYVKKTYFINVTYEQRGQYDQYRMNEKQAKGGQPQQSNTFAQNSTDTQS